MKLGVAGCALLFLASCSLFTPGHVADVAAIADCVIEHESDPIPTIAEECAIEDTRQIIDIITSLRAAEQRHAAACASASSPKGAP